MQTSPLPSQETVMAHWGQERLPLVSICCTTYNHEHFIRDTLDGFLKQETPFAYEVRIHDDASTDATAAIIREYERLYPQIIKPVYQTQNQYSQGKMPLLTLMSASNAKYIALCEGDDFWTDPRKLAIQVAFLETHPDYAISAHNACVIDESGRVVKKSKLPVLFQRDYASIELVSARAWVLTMSWVFRRQSIDFSPEMGSVANRDLFCLSQIGQHGGCKYHAEITPACYRVHPGGVWSGRSKREKKVTSTHARLQLYRYYQRIGKPYYAAECWNSYLLRVILMTNWLRFCRFLVCFAGVNIAQLCKATLCRRG